MLKASAVEDPRASERSGEYRSLLVLVMFKGLISNILRPVLPVYAAVLGAPAAVVGVIVALPDLTQVVARIPSGAMGGDIGRRGPLVACFILAAGSGLAMYAAPNYYVLFASQIVWGLSIAMFWPTTWAYLTEVVPPAMQATAIGVGLGMSGIGILAGPLLGGVIADAAGWRAPFAVYTVMAAGCLLVAASLPRKRGGQWREALQPKNLLYTYRRALPVALRPGVFLAAACQFLAMALEGLQIAFLPLYMHDLGYTASTVGAVIATRKAAAAALRFAYPALARFWPPVALAVLGLGLDLAGVAAMIGLDRPLPLMVTGVISGIGVGVAEPAGKVLITGATSSQDRGIGLGVEGTAANLGRSLGAVLVGAFAGVWGLRAGFGVGWACIAALGPALWLLNRSRRRQPQQESTTTRRSD